ncbi:MAG: MaoC/PaaZ C-terminal domain-containing protein [Bacteroidia bacterium]
MAKRYAAISGDKNPIHTSTMFAKMAGFNKRIIHGWYNASRACASAEQHFGASAKPGYQLLEAGFSAR